MYLNSKFIFLKPNFWELKINNIYK
jgi:hypothetical protein